MVEYKYDAWGRATYASDQLPISNWLGVLNPVRYRGYIYDSETGMYYLRSRYYNPEIGRFLNADVLLGELNEIFAHNSFAYCMNAPAQCKDSDGQWPSWATKLIVGAAAVLVGAAVVALTAGTASVFVPALITGLQSAAVAGAASAATSVATEVVCTVAEGGTIKDVAENALVAARDGFADGFMVGGISAGVTMMATAPLMHSNGIGVGKTAIIRVLTLATGILIHMVILRLMSIMVQVNRSSVLTMIRLTDFMRTMERRMRFGKFTGEEQLK